MVDLTFSFAQNDGLRLFFNGLYSSGFGFDFEINDKFNMANSRYAGVTIRIMGLRNLLSNFYRSEVTSA